MKFLYSSLQYFSFRSNGFFLVGSSTFTYVFVVVIFMEIVAEAKQTQLIVNVGGPDRVSRVQMAETVADIRGYNPSLIKSVSASSVCILSTVLYCSIIFEIHNDQPPLFLNY